MISLRKIRNYLTGNYRYLLYYSEHWGFLMRTHIRQQIRARINSMDKECFMQGSCKECGCMTTHLQMANDACEKPCYPVMMNRRQWQEFKEGFPVQISSAEMRKDPWMWCYDSESDSFKIY